MTLICFMSWTFIISNYSDNTKLNSLIINPNCKVCDNDDFKQGTFFLNKWSFLPQKNKTQYGYIHHRNFSL